MSRYAKAALGLIAFLVMLAVVSRLACGKPSKTDREAQTQVDSLPSWHQTVKDSQPVLDSLLAMIERVRADSARVARQVRQLRHRKDSLAAQTAGMQAALDSIPELADSSNASDSSSHWSSIALGQGHVIRTMAEEILACRMGDTAYEGRIADLEGALGHCQRRAAILEGQRNDAQLRLDRSVGLLDRMLKEKHRKFLGFLPRWVKCALPAAGGGALGVLAEPGDQLRGALLGGGSGLLGCLLS